MKKEDLIALGLTEEQANAVLAENGKDVNAVRAKLTTAETERDTYKQQAENAQREIQGYKDMDIEGIKQAASSWETKYNTDLQALQERLDAQVYGSALEKFVDGYQFTSELAKKAVVAELKEKGFKLDGSTLLGAKDFMEELKTNNPTAFADGGKGPTITLPGASKPPAGVTKEDFKKMSYAERMKIFTENKDLYDQLSK